jgi:serine protease Do
MKKEFITTIISVLCSALVAGFIVKTASPKARAAETATTYSIDGSVVRTVNLADSDYPDLTFAAESSADAVVFVKIGLRTSDQLNNLPPMFRYFFDIPQERQVSGSGVIIRSDGYIVTNNHVVAGANKIEITLNNNKSYPAKLIGSDPPTDVALLKIEAEGLPVVPFGDSDALRLGEWVLAIGSPLGEELRGTITAGIVSAKGRSMPNMNEEFKIESFIQTDAAVNPGNSGGALVNKKGELVGINTAIVSRTGSYSGYSFAVPSNIVKKIVGDLIDFGSVKRAKLGIAMSGITQEMADKMKLSSLKGVYVNEVTKGSAAEKAGMKEGDIIVKIDDSKITTPSSVQAKVNSYHPGDKAVITVLRDGKTKDLKVQFQGTVEATGVVTEDGSVAFYGGTLRSAPQKSLAAFGLKKGVEVVSSGSGKLAESGVPEGFIILYVNDQAVGTPQDIVELAKKSKRNVYIEGIHPNGKIGFFGFAKE